MNILFSYLSQPQLPVNLRWTAKKKKTGWNNAHYQRSCINQNIRQTHEMRFRDHYTSARVKASCGKDEEGVGKDERLWSLFGKVWGEESQVSLQLGKSYRCREVGCCL